MISNGAERGVVWAYEVGMEEKTTAFALIMINKVNKMKTASFLQPIAQAGKCQQRFPYLKLRSTTNTLRCLKSNVPKKYMLKRNGDELHCSAFPQTNI